MIITNLILDPSKSSPGIYRTVDAPRLNSRGFGAQITDINKQFLACPRIDIIISLLNPFETLIVISLIYLLTFDHHVSHKIKINYIWKVISHNESSDDDCLIVQFCNY